MKGIELNELSKGYYDAWSDSDFVDMVNTIEPFAQGFGAALLGGTPPEGSQGGSTPS